MKKFLIILLGSIFALTLFPYSQNIHKAVEKGDIKTVTKLLLNIPELLELKDGGGNTPLLSACLSGDFEMVNFLINKGANINARTYADNTTLLWALHSWTKFESKKKIVKLLLSKNPDLAVLRNDKGISPLIWAGNDLEETILLLLKNGADLNGKTVMGRTALITWTTWWENDRSEFLINQGADVNAKDNNGRTSLHMAAITGRKDKAKLLLKYGANLNCRDKFGFSPLDYTYKFAHKSLTDFLASKGGKSFKKNESLQYNNLQKKDFKSSEAVVWHLESNGWIVKTKNHLFIFNYPDWGIKPENPCLNNGRINPDEISDLNTIVLVSDPYGFDEAIRNWEKNFKNISYVFGYTPKKFSNKIVFTPNENKSINGCKISSFKTISGGVGFLIAVDGLVILHAGDHCLWNNSLKEQFITGLNEIKTKSKKIDIAFLPVTASREIRKSGIDGVVLAAEILEPKYIFPSNVSGSHKFMYKITQKLIELKGLIPEVINAENRGERFLIKAAEKDEH